MLRTYEFHREVEVVFFFRAYVFKIFANSFPAYSRPKPKVQKMDFEASQESTFRILHDT